MEKYLTTKEALTVLKENGKRWFKRHWKKIVAAATVIGVVCVAAEEAKNDISKNDINEPSKDEPVEITTDVSHAGFGDWHWSCTETFSGIDDSTNIGFDYYTDKEGNDKHIVALVEFGPEEEQSPSTKDLLCELRNYTENNTKLTYLNDINHKEGK